MEFSVSRMNVADVHKMGIISNQLTTGVPRQHALVGLPARGLVRESCSENEFLFDSGL